MDWSSMRVENFRYVLTDLSVSGSGSDKSFTFVEKGTLPKITGGSLELSASNDVKVTASLNFEGVDDIEDRKYVRIYYDVTDVNSEYQSILLATLKYTKSDPSYNGPNVSGTLDCQSVLSILMQRQLTSTLTVKAGVDLVAKVKELVEDCNVPCITNGLAQETHIVSDIIYPPGTSYLEVVNGLLTLCEFNDATPDAYGNVLLSNFVKVKERQIVHTFESGDKSIFQPNVSTTLTKDIPNRYVMTYETEDERLVATASNYDSNSEFSINVVGQEITASETASGLGASDINGRLAELRQLCIEKLNESYTYADTTNFTSAYYPLEPEQAISLAYDSAGISVDGVIVTMKITLAAGSQTEFTISKLQEKTIKIDSTAVIEWQRNDYEPTAYTVKDKDGYRGPIYSGNYAIWWNDIQIFPERQYTLEKNKKENIQSFTNINNTNYSDMDGAAFYNVETRDMGGNTLDVIRFLNFTSTKRWKPKSLKYWFGYDYNITDKAKQVSDEIATSPDWYTHGTGNFTGLDWSIDDQRFDQNNSTIVEKFRNIIDMSECTDLSHVWHNVYASWVPRKPNRSYFDRVCKSMYYWHDDASHPSSTSSVTTMAYMFCRDIHVWSKSGGAVYPTYSTGPVYFPCTNWCVSNLTNMEHMFDNGAPQLRSMYNKNNVKNSGDLATYGMDLSRWERSSSDPYGYSTTKNIRNMRYAFRNCKALECIDMGSWKIKTRVGDAFTGMFEGCTQQMLIRLPFKDKDEVSGYPWGASNATFEFTNVPQGD